MDILGWFASKLAKRLNLPGTWDIANWQSGRPYIPAEDYRSLVNKYTSWVYACARTNSVNCAQIPLRLYAKKPKGKFTRLKPTREISDKQMAWLMKSPYLHRKIAQGDKVEEVLDHPFIDLMKNVNEFDNEFDLLESLFLFQELTGNAYWNILHNPATGQPEQIWTLKPQYVKVVPDKVKYIRHYEYSVNFGEKQIIKPKDMIHFKYINPKTSFYGLGPLGACIVAVDLGVNMNMLETALFENRAIPDTALVLPSEAGAMNEPEEKRVKKKWKQAFGWNRKKAGNMVVLQGGAKLEQMMLSPREMNYLQGRKASKEEVAAVFGVPMSMLTSESVNRANAEAGDAQYMKKTVQPRLRKVEQKMNEQLLPMYEGQGLFVVFDNPVPEDKEFQLKEKELNIKVGFTSINEERQKEGQEPAEWGDVPYLPSTLIPIGSMPEPKKTFKQIRRKPSLPPLGHPTNFMNEPFIKTMQAYYRRQTRELLAAVDEYALLLKKTIGDFMSGWFDMKKWEMLLAEKTEPFVRYTLMSGGEQTLRQLAVATQFDPLNPHVIRAMEEHRAASALQIVDTDAKKIRKVIAEGIEEGEGIEGVKARVKQNGLSNENYRAAVIARTETIWAWNRGSVEGYMQSGIVRKKEWLSSLDERSCDFCSAMDGKIVDVEVEFFNKGDMFEVNGSKLIFDYEAVGHPPLHPQCLTGDSLVTPCGDITAVSKRIYNGKVFVIKTATNRIITCSPNHPILTNRGSIPANTLNIGSKIICDNISQGETFSDWQNINKPSLIEDIAESFFAKPGVSTKEVPVSAPAFHYDGFGSKVAIIGANRLLVDSFNASDRKHFLNNKLVTRKIGRVIFDRLCVFAFGRPLDFTTTSGVIGRFDLFLSLLKTHLRPFDSFRFALSPAVDVGIQQPLLNARSAITEKISNSIFRHSRDVEIDDLRNDFFTDSVVHISTSNFNGYVYNLETTKSYYIVNGLASHNCRCAIIPVIEEF